MQLSGVRLSICSRVSLRLFHHDSHAAAAGLLLRWGGTADMQGISIDCCTAQDTRPAAGAGAQQQRRCSTMLIS